MVALADESSVRALLTAREAKLEEAKQKAITLAQRLQQSPNDFDLRSEAETTRVEILGLDRRITRAREALAEHQITRARHALTSCGG